MCRIFLALNVAKQIIETKKMSKELKLLKRVWGCYRDEKKTRIVLRHLYSKNISLKRLYKSGLGKYVKKMRKCDNENVRKWSKGVFKLWKTKYKRTLIC